MSRLAHLGQLLVVSCRPICRQYGCCGLSREDRNDKKLVDRFSLADGQEAVAEALRSLASQSFTNHSSVSASVSPGPVDNPWAALEHRDAAPGVLELAPSAHPMAWLLPPRGFLLLAEPQVRLEVIRPRRSPPKWRISDFPDDLDDSDLVRAVLAFSSEKTVRPDRPARTRTRSTRSAGATSSPPGDTPAQGTTSAGAPAALEGVLADAAGPPERQEQKAAPPPATAEVAAIPAGEGNGLRAEPTTADSGGAGLATQAAAPTSPLGGDELVTTPQSNEEDRVAADYLQDVAEEGGGDSAGGSSVDSLENTPSPLADTGAGSPADTPSPRADAAEGTAELKDPDADLY